MAIRSVSVGALDLDDADLVMFNHFSMDDLADMGAIGLVVAARQGESIVEVRGDFACAFGDTIIMTVDSVSTTGVDEDGDLVRPDVDCVTGVAIEVPVSAVMSVLTVTHDNSRADSDFSALESLISSIH